MASPRRKKKSTKKPARKAPAKRPAKKKAAASSRTDPLPTAAELDAILRDASRKLGIPVRELELRLGSGGKPFAVTTESAINPPVTQVSVELGWTWPGSLQAFATGWLLDAWMHRGGPAPTRWRYEVGLIVLGFQLTATAISIRGGEWFDGRTVDPGFEQ